MAAGLFGVGVRHRGCMTVDANWCLKTLCSGSSMCDVHGRMRYCLVACCAELTGELCSGGGVEQIVELVQLCAACCSRVGGKILECESVAELKL